MLGMDDIVIKIGADISQAQIALSTIRTEVGTMNSSIATASTSIASNMRKIGNSMAGAGGVATGMFTMPLIYGMKSVLDEGKDFDEWLAKTSSLYDVSGDELQNLKKDLKDYALEMASTTKFDPTETMEAIYVLGQAGYELDQIKNILPSATTLATAQNYELNDSMRMIMSTLNAYNMDTTESARVSNVFAAAMTESLGEMSDLEEGIKYLLPTFSAMDYSFEDAISLMTLLIDVSYKGQNAGRILRDSVADLVSPTGEALSVLKKYGLQLYTNQEEIDATLNTYDSEEKKLNDMILVSSKYSTEMQKLIDQRNELKSQRNSLDEDSNEYNNITKQIDSVTDSINKFRSSHVFETSEIEDQKKYVAELEQQYNGLTADGLIPINDILQQMSEKQIPMGDLFTIFGKQSASGIATLIDNTETGKLQERKNAITGTIEAERQAGEQAKSTAYNIEMIGSNIDAIKIDAFYSMADAISQISTFLSENREQLAEFVSLFTEKVLVVFMDFINILMRLFKWFDNLPGGMKETIITLMATSAAVLAVVGPLMLLASAFIWSGANIIELLGGLSKLPLAIESIQLFIAGFQGVPITTFSAAASVGASMSSIVAAIGALMPWILLIIAAIGILYYAWTNNIGGIQEHVGNFIQWLKNGIQFVVDGIMYFVDWVQRLWDALSSGDIDAVKDLFLELGGKIQYVLQLITYALFNFITTVLPQWIAQFATWMTSEGLPVLVGTIANLIVSILGMLGTLMFGIVSAIIEWIWGPDVAKMFESGAEKIMSSLNDIKDGIFTWFGGLMDGFFNWGAKLIGSFIDGIKSVGGDILSFFGVKMPETPTAPVEPELPQEVRDKLKSQELVKLTSETTERKEEASQQYQAFQQQQSTIGAVSLGQPLDLFGGSFTDTNQLILDMSKEYNSQTSTLTTNLGEFKEVSDISLDSYNDMIKSVGDSSVAIDTATTKVNNLTDSLNSMPSIAMPVSGESSGSGAISISFDMRHMEVRDESDITKIANMVVDKIDRERGYAV